MKLFFVFSLLALTLTTGFTCSKNTPEAAKTDAPVSTQETNSQSQEQMAQPSAEHPEPPPPADGSEKK